MPDPQRVPPHDLDAEEAVLGSILLSPGALAAVTDLLDARDFYRGHHAEIYRAAVDLYAGGGNVDAITVADELARLGKLDSKVLTAERVHELAALVPATSNAAHYARIVHEMATLRGLIRAGQRIASLGWDRSVNAEPAETPALVEEAERQIFDLTRRGNRPEFVDAETLMGDAVRRLQDLAAAGRTIIGVPTGFRDLDLMTSGFQTGNLVVLAARPSIGKSALALGIAANAAIRSDPPVPVAVFTLEMSRWEVAQRFLSAEAAVPSERLTTPTRLGGDDWENVLAAAARVARAPLFVEEAAGITAVELRSRARRLKTRHPDLGLIVVDYIQLMGSGGRFESRTQEVSQISRALKLLAQELDVPVLALSQLSRDVEKRHDKRPILSDLRESGSIEQDADIVMFINRDEYYYGDETEAAGIAEIDLAKQRNGPTGMRKLSFVSRFAKFADLAAPSSVA